MRLLLKIWMLIGFCIETVIARIRWSNCLTVEGLFRKRSDTQIIITEGSLMKIDKNVNFQRNVSLSSVYGGRLKIGKNISFNRNCIVVCHNEIVIHDNVIFGPGVTIYDHDHKFSEEGILSGFNHGSVTIEKGCWIAANVTILRGTHIGEGSVIGAGVVVKGDIPAHSLVTGERSLKIIPIRKRIAQNFNENVKTV